MTKYSMQQLLCGLMIVLGPFAPSWNSLDAQNIYQKKTVVKAIIAGSHRLYDGTFNASGTASICGEIPKESSMTGTAVFVVEYPNDDPGTAQIQSVSFGSKQLVGNVKKGTLFTLNVAVRLPNGSKPYAYVLHTDDGRPKNSGTATRTFVGGVNKITVAGLNERGETISFSLECR